MAEETKDAPERPAIRVVKAKKAIDYKSFVNKMHPMKINKGDEEIEILRPDMLGCEVDGLHPYGSYGKLIIEKKDAIIKVWTLVVDKEHPDYIITGGLKL